MGLLNWKLCRPNDGGQVQGTSIDPQFITIVTSFITVTASTPVQQTTPAVTVTGSGGRPTFVPDEPYVPGPR
jgi:hypothetical protein